ncbi:MAG TPA: peptidase S41, partial [Tenuifilaceae bacterium]|nr:peptidase S41 [Tenuifilaceae bacterium]
MIKRITLFIALVAVAVCVKAQESPKWLRYPAISPDGQTIAFTYKGDIYTVPVSGGAASAITTHPEQDYMPVWSNDGTRIAFASNRFGSFDVFVVDAKGGEPTRLTYHSADELPQTFTTTDDAVLFGAARQDLVSHRQYPAGSQPELYSVPVNGGRVTQVLTTPAEAAKFASNGKFIVYHDKKGGENEWRKHHQSSIARDIWMYEPETGKHTQITTFKGEDRNPVLTADDKAIYFLTEEPGTFNVYKQNLQPNAPRVPVTSFKEHPVRFLSLSHNGTLCFGFDGEIYTLTEGGSPAKVNITVKGDEKVNREQLIRINGNVSEMAVSPDGKEVAFIARGEVFVAAVDGEFTKRITTTPEQEAFVSFTPDGKSVVYASERDGRWQVFKASKVRAEEPFFFASTLIKEEALLSNENDNYQPLISPDGKMIAFIENRTTLKVMNLDSKEQRTLLTPNELYYMSDGGQYFTWSPDSKWLLADYSPTMANGEVILIPVDGSAPFTNLTQSGYEDYGAKWVNKGKQILWFSTRKGLRSAANSGSRQVDVFSMFLTRDAWDKFKLDEEEYKLLKAIEEKEKKAKDDAKKKEESKDKKKKKDDAAKPDSSLKIDWDNLTERFARLTINSASIADAVLSKDGETLYYLARFEKGYNLW